MLESLIDVNFDYVQNHHANSRDDDGDVICFGKVFKNGLVSLEKRKYNYANELSSVDKTAV